ncbi:hypothetical protein FC84_GL000704 [Lapidilactobacillus dextrinicus DSM 20335]|uniref:Uncharacterized protein n=1 Tax=Lapidilactobacillus dextrinicus DSM 20335 TaxID=1423738 RepID=A0A0R2BKU7_9LACO|nr:DUF3188 domain-containing protein [Lapidilactobacillus dextrinicus]KRM80001.1 hypothetical protein FC84_GL000704 [Lapidilactobacillus dextrinicus DSM 20335]QFG46226.1 DUF3188 domain-containing protein [Lapidilactobacillus dextrinicus]
MTTNGLFLMALGFYIIMMSGRSSKNGTGLDIYLLTLGIFVVGLGFFFFHRGKKRDKAAGKMKSKDKSASEIQQSAIKKGTKK